MTSWLDRIKELIGALLGRAPRLSFDRLLQAQLRERDPVSLSAAALERALVTSLARGGRQH